MHSRDKLTNDFRSIGLAPGDVVVVHASVRAIGPNWPDRFFASVVDGCLLATGNVGGRIGDAESFLISARGLLDFARPVMERLAVDKNVVITTR